MTESDRTRSIIGISMLNICTASGCTTIVFGQGTCVEHDVRRSLLVEDLLAAALARSLQEQRQTISVDDIVS
ncbi:MAG: hypothetical protein EXQ81_07895 [Thermoleophilia bacterium]|nr:hypothetical protein [Thermoleophilia bacterium]